MQLVRVVYHTNFGIWRPTVINIHSVDLAMRNLFALICLLALSAVTVTIFFYYPDVLAKRQIPIEVPSRRNGLLLQQLALTIPQMPMKYSTSTTVNPVQSWTHAKPTKQLAVKAKEPPPNKDISPTSAITKAYKWTNVSSKGNTRLVSAYLDERSSGHPTVFLLGLHKHTVPKENFYCAFQYPNRTSVCLKSLATQENLNIADEKVGKDSWAFGLRCVVPYPLPINVAVSQNKQCKPPNVSNWIHISRIESNKSVNFGICIETPMFGKRISLNMVIEGIERNLAFGAGWITVYVQDKNPATMKVLRDYEKQGILEIVEWNLSQNDASNSHYYAESVCINDCLYRNMYRARYLIFTDLDEIIVPQTRRNWSEMMTAIDQSNTSAFLFSHSSSMELKGSKTTLQQSYLKNWTCDGKTEISKYPLPSYINHNYRTPPFPYFKEQKTLRRKTIVKPIYVQTMGIHTSILRLNKTLQIVVPSEIGLLSHYRKPPICLQCKDVLQQNERISHLVPSLFTRIRNKICQYL